MATRLISQAALRDERVNLQRDIEVLNGMPAQMPSLLPFVHVAGSGIDAYRAKRRSMRRLSFRQ